MRSLSVICLALYTVAALVIGVRLLLLARRSHGLPERLMGGPISLRLGSATP